MKRFYVIGAVCILGALSAHAAEIAGNIKGEHLKWISASTNSSHLTPSLWDISMNLPPAHQLVLGGPDNTAPQTIRLRSNEGVSVNVPITLAGMQYELASNIKVDSISGGTSSSDAKVGDKRVTVIGRGVSNQIITLAQTETPFTHYRPIVNSIEQQKWLKAFRDANAPKGSYRGSIVVKVPYDYYREGIRIRNTLVLSLTVLLEYAPAMLFDVNVSHDDVITPRYYGYPQTKVGGETTYTITATGFLPNGVLVGLQSNNKPDYRLEPIISTMPETSILYSATCTSGCETQNRQFIVNGIPKINTTSNRAKMKGNNTGAPVIAKLTVSFRDKPLSELHDGIYRGAFVLIFEADM
ncbi:hypothetical protein [Photobacterium damselae]|uniref:hypothetical protein n=1 Tax=Photobacterium damselae TaxID=38293 RepID=UPI0030F4123B